MKHLWKTYQFSFISSCLVTLLLTIIHAYVKTPMLLAERFFKGGGVITIILLSVYAFILVHKMKIPGASARWRAFSWTLFSIVFFGQLILGLIGVDECLMTGKLHFPIPAIILGGPIYRLELSFMPLLFLSTIFISGPAWCSQLCYFGAFDLLAARTKKTKSKTIRYLFALKTTFVFLTIFMAIVLRLTNASPTLVIIIASSFGLAGIAIILFLSTTQGKMMHCVMYCPIGTLVHFMKLVNPFRMYIDNKCNQCFKCSIHCKYEALKMHHINSRKPGPTCTYCGDCISSCHSQSIKYKFLWVKPETSRMLWIVVSISLHAVFMGLARI